MSELELAAHRLISREATPADIDLLARRAAAGDDVLGALLNTARDDSAARAALEGVLASAEAVELPAQRPEAPTVHLRRLRLAAPGWLAAAAVALVWGAMSFRPGPALEPGLMPVGYQPTAEEALDQYLEAGALQGRVIGELPALLVESRPVERGAEIVYIRRVLERAVVDGIVEHDVDDAGRIVERPVSAAAFARPEDL